MTDDSFRAAFDRLLADAEPKLGGAFLPGPAAACPPGEIRVQMSRGFIQATPELLLDAGLLTDEEARAQGWTPPPRPPWHRRARWRFQDWRERVGRKVGGWIAARPRLRGLDGPLRRQPALQRDEDVIDDVPCGRPEP